MKEYKVVNKTYVKSSNSIHKIYTNYTISLILFVILQIASYAIFNHQDLILPLLKSIIISLLIASIISYIINVINKETKFIKIYTEDNIHIIAIILGLLGINTNILVLSISILITLIIKKVIKNIELSSILYGALILVLYKYFNNELITPLTELKALSFNTTYSEIIKYPVVDYLIGTIYLSPIISILAFIYLFHKKSIKYNVYISYILTFSFIMFMYGVLNNMLWLSWLSLASGNILFLATYTLPDYKATPTIKETSIIYGIILGIISAILRFIIPELSIIIPMILGLLLTKPLDNISTKLKYNKKTYNTIIIMSIILIILTITGLTIIF